MARRSTPDRLNLARRTATIERLVSAGELRDRAERKLATWEASQPGGAPFDYDVAFHRIVDEATRPGNRAV